MGVGFSPDEFNTFLQNLGQQATWEPVSLCPDRVLRTGGADVTCQACSGTGFIWNALQNVVLGISQMQTTEEYGQPTEYEKGDIVITIGSDSPAYLAGEYDRITLQNAILRVSQFLIRGTDDTLKYRVPVQILEVWAVVNNQKRVLVAGTDYTLSGNVITWLSGVVQVGQQYTVTYTARPQYFIYRDLVKDRPFQQGLALPRRVQGRLMDLLQRAVN